MIFAADIPSAVTQAECQKLHDLAAGGMLCRVLEMGSQYGRSTIALASTDCLSQVHAVDWHGGDPMTGHGDSLPALRQNLSRYGMADRVVIHVGRFEQVIPLLRRSSFDGVFIDGFHEAAAVERDGELALGAIYDARSEWPGWLAFHDYGRFTVAEGVHNLIAHNPGLKLREVVDTLAVVGY